MMRTFPLAAFIPSSQVPGYKNLSVRLAVARGRRFLLFSRSGLQEPGTPTLGGFDAAPTNSVTQAKGSEYHFGKSSLSARVDPMASEGMRRSNRIPKEIPILLVGSDMEGKMFSEQTKTVLLSRHGAGIVSAYKFSPEQELIVRSLETNKEAEVRVVGQLGEVEGIYTYGVAFINQNIDFWGIVFSPVTQSEKDANRVFLQCCSCKASETVQQSDLESDVYIVNEGIVRFCKGCGSSTLWKRPEAGEGEPSETEAVLVGVETEKRAEPVGPAALAPEVEAAPKPAAKPENRRKHLRTKVSFKGCVRSFAFGDDIVTCEDISRGGMRFKSRKHYTVKAEIEVAAPYSPGAQNIFVRGQIVYVEGSEKERTFRCGVAYLKT
jgi:PilZ domain